MVNIKFVVKHPYFSLKYIIYLLTMKRRMSEVFKIPVQIIDNYFNEAKIISEKFNATLKSYGTLGQLDRRKSEVLYTIVRLIKPRIVVETGVAAGFSSCYILSALEENGAGILHSIDIGKKEFDDIKLPTDKPIGLPSTPQFKA